MTGIKRVFILTTFFLMPHTGIAGTCEYSKFAVPVSIVTENLPPYQTIDNYGNQTGYSFELVSLLLKQVQLDTKITYLPWPRAYKTALKKPNTLIFSILRTPAREALFNWIGKLSPEDYFFYQLSENNLNNQSTLQRYTVTAYSGSPYIHYLQEQDFLHIELTDSIEQSVKMLLSKRADILLSSDYSLNSYLHKMQIDRKVFAKISEQPQFSFDLYLAVSKNSESCLVEKLNSAYNYLSTDKQFQSIQNEFKESQ